MAAFGLLVLFGWFADIPVLKGIAPGLATVKPNTALGFIMAGASLWLRTATVAPVSVRHRQHAGQVAAVAVATLGAFTLLQYVTGIDSGLDRLLLPDAGRMAAMTAINFLLLGLALLLLDLRVGDTVHPSHWLALAIAANAYLAVLGHLYGAQALYQVAPMNSVALHTSVLFVLASAGVAFARPESAFVRRLAGDGIDAQVIRRLLPTALLLPPVLGWIGRIGELAGLYETPFGLALFASSNVIVFCALAWWTAGTVAASHARLRAILDNEPECVKVLGPGGVLLEMNTAGLRMLEADSLEQVRNQCIYPLIAEAQREAFVALSRGVLDGASGMLEFEIVGLRGGHRWLETHAAPMRDSNGRVTAMLGITRDITERKQAQQELASNQQRTAQQLSELELLYQTAPVGLALLDRGLRFLRVNERLADINGLAVEAHLGRTVQEVVPGLSGRLQAIYQRVLDTGEPALDVEIQGVTPGQPDRPRHWIASYLPVRDDQGVVIGVSAVVADVTESKLAEDALRAAAERRKALAQRLVEVQEAEQRRLSTELHDRIGQNLTALSINLNIIGGIAGADAAGAARLQDSRMLLQTTIAAVRDLITELRPVVLDDYGLVAGLRWFGEQVRERTGLAVAVHGEENAARPHARVEDAFFRIAQEAMTNVVKHAAASLVDITVDGAADSLVLAIVDDGVGFEPRQAAAARTPTHWGLEMMRERAEAVGASFTIVSRPGAGTRLTVEWPAPA